MVVSMKRLSGKSKIIILAVGVCVVAFLLVPRGGAQRPSQPVETALVSRGELKLSIQTKGQFQGERSVGVTPEVSGGATITYVIPEGTQVEKGEVIARLNTDDVEKSIDDWGLRVERSRDRVTQAEESLRILEATNATDISAAQVRYDMALLDLRRYGTVALLDDGSIDEDVYLGEAALPKGDAYQAFRDATFEITRAVSDLERAEADFDGMDELLEKGFTTRTEALTAELAVTEAKRRLESRQLDLKLLADYTYPQTLAQKEEALKEAERNLRKAEINASVRMTQAETSLKAARLEYERVSQRLGDLEKELKARTVIAPVSGNILYGDPERPWRRDRIAVGQRVHRGSRMFTIPDTSSIVVLTRILEMDFHTVKVGQEVIVSVDAIADLILSGKVTKVAEYASEDRQRHGISRGEKTFEVTIKMDQTDSRIKPGMSCNIEIVSQRIQNAVYVPVTSVFQELGSQVCYVVENGETTRVEVKTGRSSDKNVEILSGLEYGQRVVVADMAPVDADLQAEGKGNGFGDR